jgi:EAL domain-containing protein (putative c-di-GMP-specific phosphodiesterase class I)
LQSTVQRDALIRTFVQLGRSLEIETIAEGIEDREQLSRLRAENCDIGQGFLFARPMEANQCRQFLERWGSEAVLTKPPGTSRASATR